MERIVVGIDGSETSQRALRWALDEGRLRRAAVEVVHAWHASYAVAYSYAYGVPAVDPQMDEDAARQTLDGAVDAEDCSGLPTTVERIMRCDGAAHLILETAEGADLVVIGSRGRGGFAGLLLGSVSQQITHHATCPVVIIPAAPER